MAIRRRLDRKCKDTTGIISMSNEIIDLENRGDDLSSDVPSNTVVNDGVLTSSENTPKAPAMKADLVKENNPAEDENDSGLKAKKRKATVSVNKGGSFRHGDQVSDDEHDQSKKLRLSSVKSECSTSASESVIIPTDEQKLRSELTSLVAEHAKKCDLKDFTYKVREVIWTHFYNENSTFAQVANNRPIPGFEVRFQQIQQARGTLSQLFNQIRTPVQLSLFVRDYSSVLKLKSLSRFHDSLLSLISEHQTRKSPSFFNRFCAIQ